MGLKGWVARHTGMPSLWTDWRSPIYIDDKEWMTPEVSQLNTALSLPLAPVGAPVRYRQGGTTYTLTRTVPGGEHMLTSLDGHAQATFRWVGEDQTDLGLEVFSVKTKLGVADRWPLIPPERTFTLECLTTPAQTKAMEELLAKRSPLLLHHNKSVCQMNPCDIEAVRAVVVTKAAHARTKRRPQAERRWTLSCSVRDLTALRREGSHVTPVLIWGEWDAYDHQWRNRTYTELLRLITGAPL